MFAPRSASSSAASSPSILIDLPAVTKNIDAVAANFGLRFDKRAHTVVIAYITECTRRIVSILDELARHGSKRRVDIGEVHTLKRLAGLFLDVQTTSTSTPRRPSSPASSSASSSPKSSPKSSPRKSSSRHKGGWSDGATTHALDYYTGGLGAAYHATSLGEQSMSSTPSMLRPTLNAVGAWGQVGGGAGDPYPASAQLRMMDRAIFEGILYGVEGSRTNKYASSMTPDAMNAVRFIVDCNLLVLLTKIKSQRRKAKARRGSSVTLSVARDAIGSCAFTIPV